MRTVGRFWPRSAPPGDRPVRCDYCGVPWRRSLMVRDRAGLLACPDDQPGRDVVTLSELNAKAARRYEMHPPREAEGAGIDREDPLTPIPGPGIPSP